MQTISRNIFAWYCILQKRKRSFFRVISVIISNIWFVRLYKQNIWGITRKDAVSRLFEIQTVILPIVFVGLCQNCTSGQNCARGLNCTRGQNCTKTLLHGDEIAREDKIARRHICTAVKFARGVKFARRHFCTRRHFSTSRQFCTETLLHGGSLLHEWQFCTEKSF